MSRLDTPFMNLRCILISGWSLVAPILGASPAPQPPVPVVTSEKFMVGRLPNNTLVGVFQRSAEGRQEIAAQYSKDNGRTWGESETLVKLPTGPGSFVPPMVLVDNTGELHLVFMRDLEQVKQPPPIEPGILTGQLLGQRIDIWYTRSTNARKEWKTPHAIWQGYTGALNSIIQMNNGRLLLPFSARTSRNWTRPPDGSAAFSDAGEYDSLVIFSDDGGNTWRASNLLRVPSQGGESYGGVEPVLLQLKDDRVWMLIRTQRGRFWQSFSEDGATWSAAEPSIITSSDSPAGLARLDDKRIVLFWNDCQRYPYAFGGRQVLHAAISNDEGKTWRGYREAARDPKRNEPRPKNGDFGTAYPYPTVVNEGNVIYRTGQGEGRQLLMRLDPEWLLETSQKSDFVHGQNEWHIFGTKGVEFVPHPDRTEEKILSICKTEPDWPAGAVWNFPSGLRGSLRLRLRINHAFQGGLIALTDHFSTPFDSEDRFYNLFNLWLTADGHLTGGSKLRPGKWHGLQLDWSCAKRECRLALDGKKVATLPLLHETTGVNYLRLRLTSEGTDNAGMMVEAVSVKVSSE
jgi:hypothetical protein